MSFEREIYLTALEISDLQERAAYLATACPDDLRRRLVERMLAFDQEQAFLGDKEVPDQDNQDMGLGPEVLLGTKIDRYLLKDVIGEGGFGVVYLAEQTEPVCRTVALKIIDFGVAKATLQPVNRGSVAITRLQQFVGTPIYMSPEQVGNDSVDVDTRSDVYSLGVVLYELLTGSTPINIASLQRSPLDEVFRIVREEPFPNPSSRLRSQADELTAVATARDAVSGQLLSEVKGEIDWIIMKALEKDPTRRYQSASALAADIDAYLKHAPIEAAPPSLVYHSQKYLRRNWRGVALACVAIAALILGSIFSTVGFLRASREVERNRKLLYASDVNLSGAAMESGNIAKAEAFLRNHIDSDLRSFPWEYMWNQLHLFKKPILDHGTPVHDVIFSEDGESVISVGELGRVNVWKTSTHEAVRLLQCDMATAMTGAIADDSLAIGGRVDQEWEASGVVELWNWKSAERVKTLRFDDELGCVLAVEFMPDASTLFVATVDNLIAYDLKTDEIKWRKQTSVGGYRGTETRALAISNDGTLIATSNSKTGVVVLDANTGEQLGPAIAIKSVRCLRFSDAGQLLAIGQLLPNNADVLRLVDVETRAVATLETQNSVESIDFSPDGAILASFDWRGQVIFWDVESKLNIGTVPAHANAPGRVRFAPGGRLLATCGHDRAVKLWKVESLLSPVAAASEPIVNSVGSCTFSHDNQTIVSSARSSYPKRWAVRTGALLKEYSDLPPTLASEVPIAFSPDDRLLAAIDSENRVVIWDALDGTLDGILTASEARAHFLLSFSPDGRRLSVSGLESRTAGAFVLKLREWDVATGDLIAEKAKSMDLPLHSPAASSFPHYRIRGGSDRMRLSQDGKRFAFGLGSRLFFGVVDPEHVFQSQMDHVIVPVEMSRDGKYVAAADQSQTIRVWHTDTGKEAKRFNAPLWPGVLSFSPDGTTLAAGYYDGAIGFWDLRVEQEILHVKAHTFPVTTLQFSSDGKTLASGGWDGGIRIWRTDH